MEVKSIADINQYTGSSVNPLNTPETIYELYSVPSFDLQYPEIIKGADIGSTKATVEDGDVLICKINPRINRVWVVKHHTKYPLIASSEWIIVRNNEMDSNYLKWYFSSPTFRKLIVSQVAGIGGSLTRAQPKQVAKYPVPIPTFSEQQEIASIMDKLNNLISLRKQQLAKLDELVKARFVEMFGDPIINSKNLPTKDLIQIVKLQRGFDLPIQSRERDGNVPVYGSNGVLDYHSQGKAACGVVTGRSGTIGKVYYCKKEFWPLNTTLFSIETYGNDIIYLAYLLRYYNLERFHDGTGVPTLNRNIIHKEQIIDVPICQQTTFSSFVQQIEQSELTIQQSLYKLEVLKKLLMQEYFG